jgi:TPR repeat protein
MTRKTYDRVMKSLKRNDLWTGASFLEDKDDKHSLREAFRLLRTVVHQGLREAQNNFANAYDRGAGVRPSRRMAVHYYRKAWRAGQSSAARNLGITMRMEGRTTTAIKWFHKAIADDDPDARLDLAKIYLQDPKHHSEAKLLLEEYVAAGPQTYYSYGKDAPSVQLEDEGFEEAKHLLQDLKGLVRD